MGREKNGNSELGHAQWMREGKPEKRQQGRNKRSELGKDCGNLGWAGGLEGRVSVGKREWGGEVAPFRNLCSASRFAGRPESDSRDVKSGHNAGRGWCERHLTHL